MKRTMLLSIMMIAFTVLASNRSVQAGGFDAEMMSVVLVANDGDLSDPKNQGKWLKVVRDGGQPALNHLMLLNPKAATLPEELKSHVAERVAAGAKREAVIEALHRRWISVVEHVARQKDAHYSGLYWYTDLDAAKVEAKRTNKPILSLRLLGDLGTDLSCANSRFFRVALYANQEISAHLREHYVLHWQSVRPAPVITIEMGDGRKIVRTITGNSIHYILSGDGTVVDALPGLYGPGSFLEEIKRSAENYATVMQASPAPSSMLARYRSETLAELNRQFEQDMREADVAIEMRFTELRLNQQPDAAEAAPFARSKVRVERPLVEASVPLTRIASAQDLQEEQWQRVADLHAKEAKLDAASRRMIEEVMFAGDTTASELIEAQIKRFESAMALDTVRNQYLLRREIYRWLIEDAELVGDVDKLNRRVYAELFLTPDDDPWLGLAPADVFTGIPGGGLIEPANEAARVE